MGYAELVIDGHAAWFELLARTGCPAERITGALAVKSGVRSNTDNGVAVDPGRVDLRQLARLLDWLREGGTTTASCVLTKPARTSTLVELGALGLRPDNTGREMGRSLIDDRPVPVRAEGYDIAEATTDAELMDGLVALGDDWYDDADRRRRHRVDLKIGLGEGSPARHWVARHHAVPIAMATSFRYDDAVVLLNCGVDPGHRRRGVATALTGCRLRAAAAGGATTAVLSPSPDGYELHRRLEFDLVDSCRDRWFHVS